MCLKKQTYLNHTVTWNLKIDHETEIKFNIQFIKKNTCCCNIFLFIHHSWVFSSFTSNVLKIRGCVHSWFCLIIFHCIVLCEVYKWYNRNFFKKNLQFHMINNFTALGVLKLVHIQQFCKYIIDKHMVY